VGAVVSSLTPSTVPTWADHSPAEAVVPLAAAILGPPRSFITQTILGLLLYCAIDRFTAGWTRRKAPGTILLLLFGLVLAGSRPVESLLGWMGAGLLIGIVVWAAYVLVLRFNLALTAPVLGALSILGALRVGLIGAYPLSLAGAVLAALVIAGLTFYGYRMLSGASAGSPAQAS